MEFFILGIDWLDAGNETSKINVSGIEEEEKTAVEAQEDSSQHANQGDNECREDQINEEGEGKDFHEKVIGLYSDNSLESGNLLDKQTSVDAKEAERINTTSATESNLQTAEILESKSNNQDEQSKSRMEQLQEEHEGLPSYPTKANENSLATEENQNQDETSLSEANINLTTSQVKLLGARITKHQHETGTKGEVEKGFDNKCSQEVHTEVNFSRNGFSKPAAEAISQGTLSNTLEVPQMQDKSLILNENKETNEITLENKDPDQAVNKSNTDVVNCSQPELVVVGSLSRNGKGNVESRELTEMTPIMETVPTEFPTTQCNHDDKEEGEEEETEQPKEKIIEAMEETKENFMAVGIITEAREKPKLDTSFLQSAANEAVDIAVAELRTSPRFNFDLSMEAWFEESDQSPSTHIKTQTRSLSSRLNAATSFHNPIQDQPVSAEEESIEVERSDSGWSRAPFLIFLVTDKEKKQDSETKGVEDSWTVKSKEVALITGKGKRKPRPSLFTASN